MSRSTQKSNINFMDYHPQTFKGYIYKITSDKGKVYIGSSKNPEERFKQHIRSCDNNKTNKYMALINLPEEKPRNLYLPTQVNQDSMNH